MTENSEAVIQKCNTNCSLQDQGRFGYKHLGVSSSGPADGFSYHWANRLLGNSPNAAAIETLMGNFRIRFAKPTRICITGAKADIRVNNKPAHTWNTISIVEGDCVEISFPKSGIYNYLAVQGGFVIDEILGSKTICLREKIGPNDGQALNEGFALRYPNISNCTDTMNVSCPWNIIPEFTSELRLRFIPSAAFDGLTESNKDVFLSNVYTISPDSNKMGARLDGIPIETHTHQRFSRAVCLGTIQLPPSGLPIVLLADHQTIGGYTTLGSVYNYDCYQLAQRRPGQKVKFIEGNLEQAQQSYEDLITLLAT